MKVFKLPDLGEGLPDAEIREWHVAVGDTVAVDQPLVSMETAKAVVEVPAPWAGVIKKLHGAAGDVIAVDAALVEFQDADVNDTGTVAGTIEAGDTVVENVATVVRGNTKVSRGAGIKATPAVRALAKRLNVDLATVEASGTGGMVTADDVKRAQTQQDDAGPFEALQGTRRVMAQLMAKSHAEVVPVTVVEDADIDAWPAGTDITLRLINALVHACQQEPNLNAWYDGDAVGRRVQKAVHLGLAMDSNEGLFVPVLRDIHTRCNDSAAIRDEIERYKVGVQERSLPAEQLRGATITLSNFGNFAGRYANPIVVPPQVAIIGSGRIRKQAVDNNGSLALHRFMPLSLTFDHRAVTGGEATRFLRAMIDHLVTP